MPLVSVGGKGPPGPSEAKGWSCGKCHKVLSRRDALREHCLRKHKWCLDTNAEATPDVLEAFYQRTRKVAQRRTASSVKCPDEQDLFGSVSDITEDPEETVEPSSESEPDATTRSKTPVETVVDLTESENPSKAPAPLDPNKDDNKGTSKAAVKWTPSPLPVDRGSPCVRKQLELARPPCPMKQYLKARGITTGGDTKLSTSTIGQRTPGPGTSKEPAASGFSSLLNKAVEGPSVKSSTGEELLTCTESWPDRGKLPSVRDIVAYRRALPRETSPQEIGKLAGQKFGWENKATVTSEQYIRGVVAGHDHACRTLLDELSQHISQPPAKPEDAETKLEWVRQWLDTQNRPPTPNQDFDD